MDLTQPVTTGGVITLAKATTCRARLSDVHSPIDGFYRTASTVNFLQIAAGYIKERM